MQQWLREGGLDPFKDVNIVVVPPPQMATHLKAGNLDGYCVGEPWNSLAVLNGAGWTAAASSCIAPRHPEKVLLVRGDFAEERGEEHLRLLAALHTACGWCQRPENREALARLLVQPQYLNTSLEAVRQSLCQSFPISRGGAEPIADFHIFAGPGVNEPRLDKAVWVRDSLLESRVLTKAAAPSDAQLASMFRSDLFHAAVREPCFLTGAKATV